MPAALEEKRAKPPVGKLVLRCFLYRSGSGGFIAECVDLDIMVRANNPEEAQASLECALLGYLKTVRETAEWSLLRRPSPLIHRLQYQVVRLRAALGSHRNFRVFDWSEDQACSSHSYA